MGDALTLRYALEVDKKLGRRTEPLPVYLPAEPAAESSLLSSHAMMDVHYITDGVRIRLFDMDIAFAEMPHPVPSYAMSFEAGGRKLVYLGDIDNGALRALLRGGPHGDGSRAAGEGQVSHGAARVRKGRGRIA